MLLPGWEIIVNTRGSYCFTVCKVLRLKALLKDPRIAAEIWTHDLMSPNALSTDAPKMFWF